MDLSGMVLSDEIPVPTDLFGFPMRITYAEPDANAISWYSWITT